MLSRPARRALPSESVVDPLGSSVAGGRATSERVPWLYFLAFFIGTAVVVLGIWSHTERERRSITAHWRARVSTIADDRARLVANWLGARRADAEVLATSALVRAALAGHSQRGDALVEQLDQVTGAYGYASIRIFDRTGRLVARSSGSAEPAGSSAEAVSVARTGESHVDLLDAPDGRRILTISVPVFPEGPRSAAESTAGAVTLRMNPESGLYPLLADETVSTSTAETLLVRLDGDQAAYASPLRHPPAGPEPLRRSLAALGPHGRSSAARDGFAELRDYRNVPVLAAIRWLAPTGWGLVFKVDRDEALAELRRARQLAGAAAAFLLLALAGFLISLWRQRQRTELLRAQMEQERAILNLRGYADEIVASVPSGLLLLSADLRVLSVNRSFLDAFDLEEHEVLDRELDHVVRADGLIARAREVLRTGIPQRNVAFDLHLAMREEHRPVLMTITGLHMAEGAAARLLLIAHDLTEEERLQAARQHSEERFRDLVQGLDAIVWEADAATLGFSFASERAETVLGYPVERWLGEPDFFRTRVHPDDRDRVTVASRDAIAHGTDHEVEYRALAADGGELWLRDIVHVVRGGDGRAVQLRGLTVDVTERKRAEEALRQTEEQLRQAQKMDAVGKLAGGIAHDFNNLLMVIRGDADLILKHLPPGDPLRVNAEGIRDAAEQAATLTRQLLAFSRKQVLTPAVVDLNQVVAGLHKMLERLIGETIDLVTVTAADLGHVRADPGQLEQMLLNLAVNARDAMPDGGRLTIQTANVELDQAEAARRGARPGSYVMLDVTDTGVGMDAEMQSHIFEPFFTTKDQSKGTGLGLSTVYGIVSQSGGHIRVDSQPGKGTTFRVLLPRVEPGRQAGTVSEPSEEAAPAPRPSDPVPATGRETILLVEDAQRVRAVVREILDMQGYEVIEAGHGAEALRLSARHPGPIHLMLTDVVMPEMSGRELAQRLLPTRPSMRVLYMSGYTDDAIVRHGVLDAGMPFISKPFTPDALAAKVREILEGSRRGASGSPTR